MTLITKAGKPAKHANLHLWSDVHPYEIVKVVSDKTIEIREMETEAVPWKELMAKLPEAQRAEYREPGDNRQEWIITPNNENAVIRARKNKGGFWKSIYGEHYLAANPIKRYDYDF